LYKIANGIFADAVVVSAVVVALVVVVVEQRGPLISTLSNLTV